MSNNRIFDVIVIGAGASGCMAAAKAAAAGLSVALLEKNTSCGKKILVTGNGKCNYTNELQGESCYYGADPAFAVLVLNQFSKDETVSWFKELGVFPYVKNGYYYPSSSQASSVRDVLVMEMQKNSVSVITQVKARGFQKTDNGFDVMYDDISRKKSVTEHIKGRTVIVSCGGLAAPKTGSNGDGYYWFSKNGVDIVKQVPALVPLLSDSEFTKDLAGIRIRAKSSLLIDGTEYGSHTGEVQLTGKGVSGIPVFQLSRDANYALAEGKDVAVSLSFFPDLSDEELAEEIDDRFVTYGWGKTAEEAMIGLIPDKLIGAVLSLSNVKPGVYANHVHKNTQERIVHALRNFTYHIIGSEGYDHAQVTAGGIAAHELTLDMELKKLPGVFACGEIVDVDGICGGYNLQWAWSSGAAAAKGAYKRIYL